MQMPLLKGTRHYFLWLKMCRSHSQCVQHYSKHAADKASPAVSIDINMCIWVTARQSG